jgi:hypothetical protein
MRGSTVQKLHTDWRAGTTIPGAIKAGRGMGVLGLACVFSTLIAIDGPLLQKATHVIYAPIENEFVSLHISVLPELLGYLFSGWTPGNMTGVPGYRAPYTWSWTIPAPNNGSVPNDIDFL